MEFDPTVTERFFNRECEIEDLIDTLSGTPQGILVLTGPQNSGKTVSDGPPQCTPSAPRPPFACAPLTRVFLTPSSRMQALAREILDRWAALRSTQAEGPPSLLYLDCRAHDLGTPAELAKHMKELVTGNPGVMEQARKVLESMKLTIGQGPWSATVEDMFAPDRDVTPVASVIASYTEFLSLFEGERHRPIIYIDEANVLEAWREAGVGEPELKKLLRFFVKITKQDNRAHVVLATSSSLLEGFLRGRTCAAIRPCPLCPDGGGLVRRAPTLPISPACRGAGLQAVPSGGGGRPGGGRGAAVLLRRGRLAGAAHGVRRRVAWRGRCVARGVGRLRGQHRPASPVCGGFQDGAGLGGG
jgi:hypothetical protein